MFDSKQILTLDFAFKSLMSLRICSLRTAQFISERNGRQDTDMKTNQGFDSIQFPCPLPLVFLSPPLSSFPTPVQFTGLDF